MRIDGRHILATAWRRVLGGACAAALVLAAWPGAAPAAEPEVPAQLSYQGVLLDDQGQAQTGPVDLVVRIYDQAAGGTLLYKQDFDATPLSAGTFTVVLGPAGEASDAPDDPLTTSLEDVFAGDLVAGPGRWVEVTVSGDPALSRIQVLTAPFALRAGSAERADEADQAVEAMTVTSVNGVDAEAFSEIFEHFDFDQSPLPNDHPQEGTADVDGDGRANFIDSDNDGDGLSDADELGQGSDINLVTPTVSDLTPEAAVAGSITNVTISGTSFDPAMTVNFGSQSPTPQNVTPTQFDVDVGPQSFGFADVEVVLANGESALLPAAFEFEGLEELTHNIGNVRFSTFDVKAARTTLVGSSNDDYRIDQTGNGVPNLVANVPGSGIADFAWDPSGRVQGLRCDASGTDCTVRGMRDLGGDGLADVFPVIESFSGAVSATLLSSSIDFRASGRAVIAYVRGRMAPAQTADVVVAADADGDDDWSDPGDLIVLETGLADADVEAVVDGSDRTAVLYHRDPGAPGTLELAYDLSGDDDFDDTVGSVSERQTIRAGDVSCFDVATDASDRLVLLFQVSGAAGGMTLLHDLDGDGDLSDPGESATLGAGPVDACSVAVLSGGGLVAAGGDAGGATVYLDRNADGDFDDLNETVPLPASPGGLAIAAGNDNSAVLLGDTKMFLSF